MKFRITKIATSVSCVLGVLTLMMGSVGVQAAVSSPTEEINGTAPTVVPGELVLLSPDGDHMPDNILAPAGFIPNQFLGSTELLAIPVDEDGDIGLSTEVDDLLAQYIFTANGVPLTFAQLAQPLGVVASGKTITAKIISPVIVSSTTGAPNTSTTEPMESKILTFKVEAPLVVRANNYTMPMAAAFPTTGFNGAAFTFLMNGIDTSDNNKYTYSVDKTWLTVSAGGLVYFDSTPDVGDSNATITITLIDQTIPRDPIKYRFRPKVWIFTPPSASSGVPFKDAADECVKFNPLSRLANVRELTSSNFYESSSSAPNPYYSRSANGASLIEQWGYIDGNSYPGSTISSVKNGFAWGAIQGSVAVADKPELILTNDVDAAHPPGYYAKNGLASYRNKGEAFGYYCALDL